MVTEINLTTLKDAIITRLKTSATLWNGTNPGNGGTFTAISRGLPENNEAEGLVYPICFVTNDDELETDKKFGPAVANAAGVSEHVVGIKILFLALKETGQSAEDTLDAFHKVIKETLKGDITIAGNCTDSWPYRSRSFAANYRGKALDGRIIQLACKIHTN